jgi:hypothetical protein
VLCVCRWVSDSVSQSWAAVTLPLASSRIQNNFNKTRREKRGK